MVRLEVRICGARNVGNAQKVGLPDPYVKIMMGDKKKTRTTYKTKVATNSPDPVWNEVVTFHIADNNTAQVICELWNDNVTTDDLLGSYPLSLKDFTRGVVKDMWVVIGGTHLASAELHLQALAVDFGADPQPGSAVVRSIEEYDPTAPPKAMNVG
ncbi:hypothetical protein JKF63_03817 [Porcisia hertigi]|uniref:C2 domain-containing protein n=1 Tax=Porcisia hertigi TaxID=2761500 RepID=A0A836IC39_9TRYP|nr:hypothetical protein JKF63_03817 [Porcisia hertigi]